MHSACLDIEKCPRCLLSYQDLLSEPQQFLIKPSSFQNGKFEECFSYSSFKKGSLEVEFRIVHIHHNKKPSHNEWSPALPDSPISLYLNGSKVTTTIEGQRRPCPLQSILIYGGNQIQIELNHKLMEKQLEMFFCVVEIRQLGILEA